MKRLFMSWLAACLLGITTVSAYSLSSVRSDARFLTDRMAYEMGLSVQQYDDIYEVNFDFINNVRGLMPAVVRGEEWALNDYYRLLDVRNDDLRWILSLSQYTRFAGIDYFFRPIYTSGRNWLFRVYTRYPDRRVFYYNNGYCPAHYRRYGGEHARIHTNNVSYYRTHFNERYHHPVYEGNRTVRTSHPERNDAFRKRDFGVTRPNNSIRPNSRNDLQNRRQFDNDRRRMNSNRSASRFAQPQERRNQEKVSTSSRRNDRAAGRTERSNNDYRRSRRSN